MVDPGRHNLADLLYHTLATSSASTTTHSNQGDSASQQIIPAAATPDSKAPLSLAPQAAAPIRDLADI